MKNLVINETIAASNRHTSTDVYSSSLFVAAVPQLAHSQERRHNAKSTTPLTSTAMQQYSFIETRIYKVRHLTLLSGKTGHAGLPEF
jgi:hypothetical protein